MCDAVWMTDEAIFEAAADEFAISILGVYLKGIFGDDVALCVEIGSEVDVEVVGPIPEMRTQAEDGTTDVHELAGVVRDPAGYLRWLVAHCRGFVFQRPELVARVLVQCGDDVPRILEEVGLSLGKLPTGEDVIAVDIGQVRAASRN